MPLIEMAQSIGVFLFVCVAAAAVLSAIIVGLARLEVAAIAIDRRGNRRV